MVATKEIEAGYWVSLKEYLELQNISLSTARRRIKTGRVKAELRKGKYYIYILWERPAGRDQPNSAVSATPPSAAVLTQQVNYLRQQVQQLAQENSDLRMLVQAYEVKLAGQMAAAHRN